MELVILAAVAAFILLRLRSELGNKTGNEPLPPAAGNMHGRHDHSDGMGDDSAGDRPDVIMGDQTVIDLEQNPALRKAYQDIRHADRSFDLNTFMTGAKAAYEMILEAFWKGDKETLREFLDDSVYEQFAGAVDKREADGLVVHNKILDVTEMDIIGAQLIDRTAELTVHFRAELIAVTKDKDGNVVEGNVSDAVEVNDKWTFARDTKSRTPMWTLVATRAG
ncbi:Tim44/TimA family putative adaptor protein [Kordiimonas lacus]|uniref:Predicted lipid-binding transport protein, Tim44 family n=1 Tax=Kordiimonas lacus TaxID=637679 RepID=A0A1G6TGS2_9PROT|nr:Tim44/TimA family putative adaptor protein [Kordiimonas lacus]SDD28362.1 Predicted lipid-binding transport protein, Tim44 family [Kordiimonas lacus]